MSVGSRCTQIKEGGAASNNPTHPPEKPLPGPNLGFKK